MAGKALAQSSGYRILSLPGEPYQTKYPPLYPLLLSAAWRIDTIYPANLPIALLLSWLGLPVVLLLAYLWASHRKFPVPINWLVVALFGTILLLRAALACHTGMATFAEAGVSGAGD